MCDGKYCYIRLSPLFALIFCQSPIKGEYIPELTPSQARIALKGLADIDQSLSLMTAVIPPDFPLVSDVQYSRKSPSKKSSKAMISIAALSGGAGGIVGSFVGYLLIQKQAQKITREAIENLQTLQTLQTNLQNINKKVLTVLKNGIDNYPDFQNNISQLPNDIFQLEAQIDDQIELLSNINQINPGMPIGIGFLIGVLIAGTIALVDIDAVKNSRNLNGRLTSHHPKEIKIKGNSLKTSLIFYMTNLKILIIKWQKKLIK